MDDEQVGQQADITGNGNVVGDESISQVVKAIRSIVKNVVQIAGDLIVKIPAWGLIVAALLIAASIVLAVAISNIPTLQKLLPTPTAFDPAGKSETLIIVAKFDNRSEGRFVGVDPSSPIYDFVLRAAQDNPASAVRVERYEQLITNSQDAQKLGEQYAANLVIWGWYNSLGAQPYVELIGERTIQGEGIALETPTPMAFYFLKDIPSQSAYLGLFAIGMTHIIVESSVELRQAIAFFDAAVSSVVEGTRVKPWEAYVWRANCYYWLSEYDTAARDYDRALYLNPADASGYFNRGCNHAALGEHEEALADYGKAIELDPELAAAYYNRGNTYLALGEYEKALADYDKVIELDPEHAQAYNNRGVTYHHLGEYEKALADCDKAIELDPEDAEAYNNRGIVYRTLGEYERAIADYTKAIELDPELAQAHYNRGNTYHALGEYEKALADYGKAIELNLEDAAVYYNRGNTYRDLGEYEKALADYGKAIELDPELAQAHYNRGNTYADLGGYGKALADFSKAIELDPEYADAYFGRGLAYKKTDQVEKAIADLNRFLELSNDPYWREQAEQHLRELRGE